MPVYEYECAKCAKVHEVEQRMSDPKLKKCPECKGPVQKLISLSGFALKGSGFYTTDYKRAGKSSDGAACTPTGCGKPQCST